MTNIQDIHCIADELRMTPARKFTKARLVELGEMLEWAISREDPRPDAEFVYGNRSRCVSDRTYRIGDIDDASKTQQ